MNDVMTMGVLATPKLWYELPPEAWTECGPPRREKAATSKTGTEDDYKVLGRPEIGLKPLEDACRRVGAACKRIQDRQAAVRENELLYFAREYDRAYQQFGFYAVDVMMEQYGVTRGEVADRLARAERVAMGEAA